jgi:hypothetical protein
VTTCSELATALRGAGPRKWLLEFIAENGFIPAVTRPDGIKDPAHPCTGAVPRKHSHFFTKSRNSALSTGEGEQVDDGTYRALERVSLRPVT